MENKALRAILVSIGWAQAMLQALLAAEWTLSGMDHESDMVQEEISCSGCGRVDLAVWCRRGG